MWQKIVLESVNSLLIYSENTISEQVRTFGGECTYIQTPLNVNQLKLYEKCTLFYFFYSKAIYNFFKQDINSN